MSFTDWDTTKQRQQYPPARFYVKAVKNEIRSAEAGRSVYDDVEMIEIYQPGDRRTETHLRVTDEYRRRYPQAYAAFKEGQEAPLTGTAIEEWPPITPSEVFTLKSLKIRTVEELAAVPDGLLQNIGHGALALRTRAQNWLKAAEGGATVEKLHSDLSQERDKVTALTHQVDELRAIVERLTAKKDTPNGVD